MNYLYSLCSNSFKNDINVHENLYLNYNYLFTLLLFEDIIPIFLLLLVIFV